MHIPKTSGIAVAHALVAAERPPRVFFGFDRAFFGAWNDFASLAPQTRAFIYPGGQALPRGETVIRAHMSLGTLRAGYPDGRFMTVLREPSCRLLSHYVFWRGFTPAQLAGWGSWAAVSGLATGTLAAFMADTRVACQIDNVATRLLLWPHTLIPDAGMIDPTHDTTLLAAALERLAALDFVDVIDSPGFAGRLAGFLGIPPSAARHNESPALPPALRMSLAGAMTAEACDLMDARTRLDRMLWRHVASLRGEDERALQRHSLQRGFARFAELLGAGAAQG